MSQVYITGHKSPDTDSIAAAISYTYLKRKLGMDAVACRAGEPNKETKYALQYFGVEAPKLITNVARKNETDPKQQVILVDHNESKQCVDGIKDADVIEVVDHHRIGDFESEKPIFMLFRPLGCVNTVIYGLYKLHQVKPDQKTAGMMVSAIISDTLLFRSPTTTEEDKKAAKELAEIAGIDLEKYGMDMLKTGADISDYPVEKLAANDTKEFEAGGHVFTVGQLSIMDEAPIDAKKKEIMAVIEKTKKEKGYAASFMMVTNILTEETHLWYTDGAEEKAEEAFNKKAQNGMIVLPHVMSRKKQVAPFLLKVFEK